MQTVPSLRLRLVLMAALSGAVAAFGAPPLVTDDADIVPPGELEIVLGYAAALRERPQPREGALELAFGLTPHLELGLGAGRPRGGSTDLAAGIKGVTHPGADDGWGFGLAAEHGWLRGVGREIAAAALATRFTPWGGCDTNVGLGRPTGGSTAWFAGQSVRFSPAQGWGLMGEAIAGGRVSSARLDTVAVRAAATYTTGNATGAIGLERALKGGGSTTAFAALILNLPFAN